MESVRERDGLSASVEQRKDWRVVPKLLRPDADHTPKRDEDSNNVRDDKLHW